MRACTVLARTEALILRTGTFSATLKRRVGHPPADIKRRDGRLNYYSTHLYTCAGEIAGREQVSPTRELSLRVLVLILLSMHSVLACHPSRAAAGL